jgi:hypothetical protein
MRPLTIIGWKAVGHRDAAEAVPWVIRPIDDEITLPPSLPPFAAKNFGDTITISRIRRS